MPLDGWVQNRHLRIHWFRIGPNAASHQVPFPAMLKNGTPTRTPPLGPPRLHRTSVSSSGASGPSGLRSITINSCGDYENYDKDSVAIDVRRSPQIVAVPFGKAMLADHHDHLGMDCVTDVPPLMRSVH